jgi:hypothetical protein
MATDIVTWHLKARMVESEKTAIARQLLVKHVTVATDLEQRHIHGNDFLERQKDGIETLEGGNFYSVLPKL